MFWTEMMEIVEKKNKMYLVYNLFVASKLSHHLNSRDWNQYTDSKEIVHRSHMFL